MRRDHGVDPAPACVPGSAAHGGWSALLRPQGIVKPVADAACFHAAFSCPSPGTTDGLLVLSGSGCPVGTCPHAFGPAEGPLGCLRSFLGAVPDSAGWGWRQGQWLVVCVWLHVSPLLGTAFPLVSTGRFVRSGPVLCVMGLRFAATFLHNVPRLLWEVPVVPFLCKDGACSGG